MIASDTWIAVLSSSLLTAAIGGLLAGIFALRAKSRDYINDYYKQVLEKRWEAYQLIETLIFNFKVASPDSNLRMIHQIFYRGPDDNPGSIYTLIIRTSALAFWLSDDIFAKSREIDVLLLQRTSDVSWQEFGALHYREFARIRVALERLYSRDLASLHRVPKFLNSKRHQDKLEAIRVPLPNRANAAGGSAT